MQKLTHLIILCLFSIMLSSCSSIFKGNSLPKGLVVASDICSSQKHSDCHYDYDSYEDSYQPPVQLEAEEKMDKDETKEIPLMIIKTTQKNQKETKLDLPKAKGKNIKQNKSVTTIKEKYKISVEINDISTERAIDKVKNSKQYSTKSDSITLTEQKISSGFDKDTTTKIQVDKKENIKKNKEENTLIKKASEIKIKSTQQKQHTDTVDIMKNDKKLDQDILTARIKSDFFLEEVKYTNLPKFSIDNIKPAFDEFLKACKQFTKDESKWIKSEQIAIDRQHMLEICKDGESIKIDLYKYKEEEKNKVIEGFFIRWFSPYKVFSYGKDTGTFTGYYEAHIKGSTKATCDYLYPIYGLPDNPEHQKFTREEINNGALRGKAKILFWAKNPVDIYLTHIQGSGVVETDDGKQYRIGYAGNNGYSFTGTGETIKKMGLHPEKGLSMTSIREFLNKNPEIAKKVMNANKRFIFFKENKQNGAIGTFGTTLTAAQTIAVDQSYIPLGLPVYIDVKNPNNEPLNKITIAADTGSAIKGGIRADFFFGFGESALAQAGRMKQSGKYFILLPKNQDKFMVKSNNIKCLD